MGCYRRKEGNWFCSWQVILLCEDQVLGKKIVQRYVAGGNWMESVRDTVRIG